MSLLGNLMAVGRTIAGVSQKPEYRIHRGPAVPGINLGSPRGFGNGLCDRIKQDILRRTAPSPVREQNPFTVNSEEPRSLEGWAPASAGGRSQPNDGGNRMGVTPPGLDGGEETPSHPLKSEPGRLRAESDVVGASIDANRISDGWLGWILRFRWGSSVTGGRRPLVQEELHLNDVRPVRSRLLESTVAELPVSAAERGPNRLANPFSVKIGVGTGTRVLSTSAPVGTPPRSAPARTMADRLPNWLRRGDRRAGEETLGT